MMQSQNSLLNNPYSGPKKVVSIPVHFIESDTWPRSNPKPKSESESESSLKIQKAFRGFRVRKNVKKIIAIRRDVDDVEKKILEPQTIQLVRKDSNERLRINESLMALLLKLDSVRGFDDGVRDLRKSVIKKAIELQEKIDSLCSAVDDGRTDNETEVIDNPSSLAVNSTDNMMESASNEGELQNISQKNEPMEKEEEEKEEKKRSKEKLLEKMAEDQEMMMALVADLCERNAAQASLIDSLSRRVEQLEKTMNDNALRRKMKNKKKKTNATLNGFVYP